MVAEAIGVGPCRRLPGRRRLGIVPVSPCHSDITVSPLSFRSAINRRWSWSLPLCTLALLLTCITCKVHAQDPPAVAADAAKTAEPPRCLPDGSGYLRARLKGSIDKELDWGNENTECTGAVRPADGGIRMRFTRRTPAAAASAEQPDAERPDSEQPDSEQLVLVFGIAGLHEGKSARTLPVNVTVIREGAGEFYGTQGDDKCMLDSITQTPIVGIPRRSRSYRIVARGFCTEPARAVNGSGAVLISRFDYAGRVDFETEDVGPDPAGALTEIQHK